MPPCPAAEPKPALDGESVARLLRTLFGRDQLTLRNESSLHRELAARLTAAGVSFRQEVRLGEKKRPDFVIGSIAVEVKVGGTEMAILRQLKRYADDSTIAEVILLTTVPVVAPATLGGKSIHVINLWRNLI